MNRTLPTFIGSAKDLIERRAKKTANQTNQGSEEQPRASGDEARENAERGRSTGELRSSRIFLGN